jgi:hypothetical protein
VPSFILPGAPAKNTRLTRRAIDLYVTRKVRPATHLLEALGRRTINAYPTHVESHFLWTDYGKHLDGSTQLTLAITLALFVVALFEKGFTHDLLLEAAVFLVSAKLVVLPYKASVNNDAIAGQLAEMSKSLTRVGQSLERNRLSES